METIKYIIFSIPDFVLILFLIIELICFVKKAIKEKNWSVILKMLIDYMTEAEEMFESGAGSEKKAWVMKMIEASAKTINYDIDLEVISQKIDELCAMTKTVNVKNEQQ